MAHKRMFSLSVVDTDKFLEMPLSSRLLYYELGMRADDDGFVDNWKKILLFTGLKEDDMKVLITKNFVIPFESGVIVIRHWRLNNYLQNDRVKHTIYQDELKMLDISKGNEYFLKENIENKGSNSFCIQNANNVYTQNRIEENRIEENSIDIYTDFVDTKPISKTKKQKHKFGEYKNVLLTDDELEKLKKEYSNYENLIKYLDEYIEMKGYKAKSHYLCIKKWVVDAVGKQRTIPEWFDKETANIEPTEEEKEEIERLLGSF